MRVGERVVEGVVERERVRERVVERERVIEVRK